MLFDDVERLAEHGLQRETAEGFFEAPRVTDHPDGVDLGAVLQGAHDVGHKRQAVDLEIDLALAVHGLGRTTVARGHDRRDGTNAMRRARLRIRIVSQVRGEFRMSSAVCLHRRRSVPRPRERLDDDAQNDPSVPAPRLRGQS